MQYFNKPLYEGQLGGFKVTIHKTKTIIKALSDNTFEVHFGMKHPIHRISLLSIDANDLDSIKVVANLMYSTSQALVFAEISEIKKLNKLLNSIAENYQKRNPPKPISEEEQEQHLQVVKDIQARADMPRSERRRLDKNNIKNIKKNTNGKNRN